MSGEPPDPQSVFDAFFDDYEPSDFDVDAYIGEPPAWYYPLVGRVAVATGGLELRFAEAALCLLGWAPGRGGDQRYWLQSAGNLRTLLGVARGLNPEFDELARELPTAWAQRNEVVHVHTGWHDWDSPEEPSGWHYEHPKTNRRVYLTEQAKQALEQVLATILALDQRVWELYRSLEEPSVGESPFPDER